MASEALEIGPNALRGVRVLIVDDNADARAIYRSLMAYAGASVTAVPSAAMAIKALRRARPDIVLSDLLMPRRDGRWLLQWIRGHETTLQGYLPVIAVTALGDLYTPAEMERVGFDDYLTKPVTLRELVCAIERLRRRPRASTRSASETLEHGGPAARPPIS